jgi:hypothetical protein
LENFDERRSDSSVEAAVAARDLSQHHLANEQEMSYAAFIAHTETFYGIREFQAGLSARNRPKGITDIRREGIGDIETEIDLRRARLMMQLTLKEIEGVTDPRSGVCLLHVVTGGSRFGPN